MLGIELVKHTLSQKDAKIMGAHEETIHCFLPLANLKIVHQNAKQWTRQFCKECYFVCVFRFLDKYLQDKHEEIECGKDSYRRYEILEGPFVLNYSSTRNHPNG